MRKVLYVPLDDRDCNYQFPWLLSQMTEGLELLRPPYEWMGFLKKPADREKIWEWLFEQAGECDYAILSVDTLVMEILSVREFIRTVWKNAGKLWIVSVS